MQGITEEELMLKDLVECEDWLHGLAIANWMQPLIRLIGGRDE